MKKKSIFQIIMLLLLSTASPLFAENSPMRGNAKFNVVAAVLVIIFVGIVVYLVYLDRKVTAMENDKENQS
ncbi:MAG: CcmD family protein [Bacteroidetes bacterium]|nr:CcmD family protein [Bacteroidota bacterium]